MSLQKAPEAFLDYNTLQTKNLALVVDIDGLDLLTTRPIFQRIRYGDPINYGDPGIVYNGLRPVGLDPNERQQRDLVSLEGGSTTIQQKLEPEQGRAAISTLSLSFIDKDSYMTQAVSPGVIIDEILGREVSIWIGYIQNSFPEEYYVVWRGRVTQINVDPGRVTLQFSDPNVGKRQEIFYSAITKPSSPIAPSDTTINVTSNGDFHKKIYDAAGQYTTDISLYLKIDDEFIEYQQPGAEGTGFGVNQFIGVLRGQRGTTPAAHNTNADVKAYVELSGHAIDMALRLMLSGWNGPYLQNIELEAFRVTGDPNNPDIPRALVLPVDVDAVRDYGIQPGDFIVTSGAGVPSNNDTFVVIGFQDSLGYPNKIILVNNLLTPELSTPAVMSFRSQYDVLPTTCGVKLSPVEVDVGGHQYYKQTFLGSASNSYRFLIADKTSCKTFIESEIMLPLGAYCLTRQGKLSMGLTKPPIADQRTVKLDFENIIEPNTIRPMRGTNNRKFFNEIQWQYDKNDEGNYTEVRRTLDSESLSLIKLSSVLPISTSGSRTDLGFLNIVSRRERFLLNRYKRGAVLYTVKTNFGVGNQIEAGDVVIFSDEGELQITNMSTGERDLGVQLFEVIDRSLDIKSGMISLTLQGGIGANADDRFATIAPSSLVSSGSTNSVVRIKDSFGAIFPNREFEKWTDYIGLNIIIHSKDFTTRYAQKTLTGFSASDPYAMLIDSPLSFVPQEDDVIDLAPYPDDFDTENQKLAKLVHCFWDRPIPIVGSISDTQFDISIIYLDYIKVNQLIYVYKALFTPYTDFSPEVTVVSIVGTTVTVDKSLGFVPNTTHRVGLAGFKDGGGAYRFI